MASLHPRLDDLPNSFPVFPLPGALLLPHGRLPLNIFEPRYLAMTEDALGAGRIFGMIQPDPRASPIAEEPGLYRVGCVGRISSFSETNDGRYLITLAGIVRFEVAEELPMHRGYRRVRAELSRFSADLDASSELRLDREALLAALRRYFAQRGIDANWDALAEMPDHALVVTLSMVCPFDPTEKQALLEAPTSAERAEVLLSLLLIDSHAVPADTSPHFRAS